MRGSWIPLMQPLECRHSPHDQGTVILGEVSHRGFVPPNYSPLGNEITVIAASLTQLSLRSAWRIRQQRIQQGRLASAVASHQRNLLAAQNACREIANYTGVTVRLGNALDLQNVLTRRPLLLKFQEGALDVRTRQFRDLQTFNFLATGLNLARAGARRKSRNELI